MPSAVLILAAVAFLLFLIALFPATEKWPLTAISGLLLSIAVFLLGRPA